MADTAPKPFAGKIILIALASVILIAIAVRIINGPVQSPAAQQTAPSPLANPTIKLSSLAIWNRTVLGAAAPCEAAFEKITAAESSVDGYEKAKVAVWACREAWNEGKRFQVPAGLSASGESSAANVVKYCSDASLSRKDAAEKAMVVLDGDVKPSAQVALKEAVGAVKLETIQCAAAGLQLARDEGLDPNAFGRAVVSK